MGALAHVLAYLSTAAAAAPAAGRSVAVGSVGLMLGAVAAPGAEGEGEGKGEEQLLRQGFFHVSEVLGRCLVALMQVRIYARPCVCVCVCV